MIFVVVRIDGELTISPNVAMVPFVSTAGTPKRHLHGQTCNPKDDSRMIPYSSLLAKMAAAWLQLFRHQKQEEAGTAARKR